MYKLLSQHNELDGRDLVTEPMLISLSIKHELWTVDYGLGIKYRPGIKSRLEHMDWV